MKLRYIRAFIVLMAGLVTLIVNIKTHKDVTVSMLILLVVILIFYVFATLAVELWQKSVEESNRLAEKEEDEEVEEEQKEEVSEEETESTAQQISFEEEEI